METFKCFRRIGRDLKLVRPVNMCAGAPRNLFLVLLEGRSIFKSPAQQATKIVLGEDRSIFVYNT